MENNTWIAKIFDALSLSGAIIFMFFVLTCWGIATNQEKVWTNGLTALTTFVAQKTLTKKNGDTPSATPKSEDPR